MARTPVVILSLLALAGAACAQATHLVSIPNETAHAHELLPHRSTIPTAGIDFGSHELRLKLIVSPTGDVVHAEASGEDDLMRFWPSVEGEIAQWRFEPFAAADGRAATANVEESVALVPPERALRKHVLAPELHPGSKVSITLSRSACYGSCPAYTVTLSNTTVVFDGSSSVVATGRHTAPIAPEVVRRLVQRFVADDFYSLDDAYRAGVTDCPTYRLTIVIDGRTKSVEDYMGTWEGMPAVVTDLEKQVDAVADTKRWVEGTKGLVRALQAEHYHFSTFEAQVVLKAAASNEEAGTVQELLSAGVPLVPYAAPRPKSAYEGVPFQHVGWLAAAARSPKTLVVLMQAGASREDQRDKDTALLAAAESGLVESVRALIAYGANPKVDVGTLTVTEEGSGLIMQGPGSGSVLISAAASGNPAMVREILQYHPKLEARDSQGRTAIFAAGEYRSTDQDGARAECVRLLAQAGAEVNVRDNDGDTPLHKTFQMDVEEELLRLGADVNARNKKGETPIFTTYDDNAIALFLQHGADITVRSDEGKTVMDAAEDKGPQRQEALRKAVAEYASR